MHARKSITLTALSLALALSGCAAEPAATPSPTTSAAPAPIVGAASWMPSTFSAAGIWTATTDPSTPLATGLSGIASISGGVITVRDGVDGRTLWSSAPIVGSPLLSFAVDGGKEYLLAIYGSGTPDARIDAYLTTRSGEGVTPASSTPLSGEDVLTIKASPSGALISREAERTVYRPSRASVVPAAPNSVTLVNDSTLTLDRAGTFGLVSLTGATVWSSAGLSVPGAQPGSRGTFLAESNGVVAAKWPGTDGKDLQVLVRAVSGTVVAVAPADAAVPAGALLVSQDGRWAVYAQRLFNAATGAAYELPADLKAAVVDRAVVYSADAHGVAYDAVGKLKFPTVQGAPKLITPHGQGVFHSGTEMTVGQMNSLGVKALG